MAYQLSEKELKGITDTIRENARKTESTPKQPSAAYTAFQNYLKNGPEKNTAIQTRGATNVQKLDVQKKKEDRLEVKSTVNAAEIKRDRAKKQYEDYINSEEYRKKQAKSVRAQQLAMDRDENQVFSSTSDMMPPAPKQDQKEYMLRLAKEAAEQEYNESEDRKVIEQDLEAITGLSEDERKQLEQFFVNRDLDYYEGITAASKGDFSTPYLGRAEQEASDLIEKYGLQRVQEMANTLDRMRNAEMTESVAALGQQQANSGFLGGSAASAASVPVGVLSGPSGILDRAKELTRKDDRFKTLDPNSLGNLGNVYSGAVRGQVAQNISGDVYDEETGQKIKDGGFLRELGSVGYQALMSSADSVARAYMGGGAFGGATLAATGSFSQTMADASRNGATPAQAALLATTTAGIEALTEKIPLDNLIRTAKGKGLKSAILNALRQAGIEATTEEVSLIGTILAEAAILQEKSGYQRDVMTAIMDGASVDDAVLQASQNIVDEAINTALVSMISGGFSSLGGSYADYRGWFAEEQAQNNPALNQPKQGDVIKSKEALLQKYGQADAQQAFNVEQDRLTAPKSILTALENQQKDDRWSDTVAPYRAADMEAIKNDPKAMQWLSERGMSGDLSKDLNAVQSGKYQPAQQTQTAETPQTTPVQQEAAQPAMQQEAPQQAQQTTTQQSEQQNLTDIYTEMFTQMRENNGKASNRMAESVMSDPAAPMNDQQENLQQAINPQTAVAEIAPVDKGIKPIVTDNKNTSKRARSPYDIDLESAPSVLRDFHDEHQYFDSPVVTQEEIARISQDAEAVAWLKARGIELNERSLDDFGLNEYNIPGTESISDSYSDSYSDPYEEKIRNAEQELNESKAEENRILDEVEDELKKDGRPLAYAYFDHRYKQAKRNTENIQKKIDSLRKEQDDYVFVRDSGITDRTELAFAVQARNIEKRIAKYEREAKRYTPDYEAIDAASKFYKEHKKTIDFYEEKHRNRFETTEDPSEVYPAEYKIWREYRELRRETDRAIDDGKVRDSYEEYAKKAREQLERLRQDLEDYKRAREKGKTIRRWREFDPSKVQESYKVNAGHSLSDSTGEVAVSAALQQEAQTPVPTEADLVRMDMNSTVAGLQETAPTAAMGANNQSAEGGQIKGTGAAERNFSGVAAYEDMLSDDNMQRQRPNAARDVEMPKVDSDGRRVTEFAKNVSDAEVTPEPLADAVKSLVGDKKLSFDTRSNQESLNNAAEAIRTQGDTAVIADIHAHAEAKTVKDGDIEKGLVLYAQYANDPDPKSQETAAQIIVDMAALANMSGRNLQLFSLMQRLTPEGRIKVLKKDLSRSIKQINAGRSKNKQVDLSKPGVMTDKKALGDDVDVYINEELAQKFLDAKTDKEKEAVMDEIYKDVASRIKPTLGEVWDAWRNLAMLGNFKTHERNILSTAAYQPYQSVKRVIGTVLEKILRLDPEQRTKSVLGIGKKSQDLLKWTRADAKNDNVQKLMQRSGTTGNEARSAIQEYRQILPGILDKASKKNMELMEKADMRFKMREYALSLASFLKARGYTAADLQNGNVPNGVLDEGRQIAVREAMKATFNDSNKLSDALVKYGKANERDGSKVLNIFKKGTVPYLRTPANVVARAVENNPLTAIVNLATAKKDIESGRKSAADVLDGLSANLTGGVGVALGILLGSGAFENVELIGSIEDEEELREGAQEYSVRIGDKYYNVAWLAPAMIPLFLGANLARNNYFAGFQDADGWDIAKAFVDLGADTLEPILELSMLSSLNDAVKKFTNEEDPGDGAMAVFLNSLTSYVQQGLPTIIGQAEQATETEKSSTFVNTDNKLEEIMKNAISYASKRVPGVDLYQTQKLDEWGNVVQNEGDADSRIFNAFFNPSTVTTRKTDPVMQEIARLNKSQENNVSPNYAPKVITYTDKDGNLHKDQRLTEEQYQTFAKTQGQTARQLVEELIKSRSYETMSDEQKAEAINLAYTYARETAEKAAFPDSLGYSEKWLMETDAAKNKAGYILNKVGTAMLSGAMGKIDTAWDNNYSAENVKSLSDQLAKDFEAYSKMPRADKAVVYEGLTGTTKKYVEAREKGVSHDDFMNTAKAINDVKGTGKYDKNTGKNAVRDIDKRAAIAGVSNLTPGARDILMKAYMTDYDRTDESPTKTEPKYDFIRKEMGLSAKDYVDSYRVYLDVAGKNNEIKGIMNAINCDYATARKLRNLYGGWYKGSDWKNYIADY